MCYTAFVGYIFLFTEQFRKRREIGVLKRTYLLSGIAVLTALGLMACGSSGSGQTEAKGSVSGNSGTEAAANEESLNFTMALVDNSQSNYYKGAEKIAELVSEATEGKSSLPSRLAVFWVERQILWIWRSRVIWTSLPALIRFWPTIFQKCLF